MENLLKKHFQNMTNKGELDLLNDIKQEFIGSATYINWENETHDINIFGAGDNYDDHLENLDLVIKKLEDKKNTAKKIHSLTNDNLHLVVNYLPTSKIASSLELMDDASLAFDLYGAIKEMEGHKVIWDENGTVSEIIYN